MRNRYLILTFGKPFSYVRVHNKVHSNRTFRSEIELRPEGEHAAKCLIRIPAAFINNIRCMRNQVSCDQLT